MNHTSALLAAYSAAIYTDSSSMAALARSDHGERFHEVADGIIAKQAQYIRSGQVTFVNDHMKKAARMLKIRPSIRAINTYLNQP